MAGAVQLPSKNVLQQTNNNVPVISELREADGKGKKKRRFPQETENRAVTSRLRKVRLNVSSQGLRGECYRECSDDGREDEGEEDEGEEEGEEEVVVVVEGRKQATRPIIPNYVTKNDKGQYRKRRKSRSDALDLSSQKEGRQQAASVSIAKRNARERNRVKLVNQGFATLRSRIPDYISEMYTEERKKKKVSKVETLRMAVGYIRHLTDMLELRTEWFPSGSSTGYPSPIDTDYQESPSSGVYSRDPTLYDYDLELETVKDIKQEVEEADNGDVVLDFNVKEEVDKDSLLIEESAFSVSVGCCYDLDKPEMEGMEHRKTPPLPSITESFPKKNLRAFYESPSFLSSSSTFHL